jgi:hypothetical protein
MANKITFNYGGKEYVLEFTRKSVEEMERRGFVAADVLTKPLTVLPSMFAGAFIANHRFTKKKVIDEIYAKINDKEGLINTLAEMYSLVIDDFVDELEKKDNGLSWKRI